MAKYEVKGETITEEGFRYSATYLTDSEVEADGIITFLSFHYNDLEIYDTEEGEAKYIAIRSKPFFTPTLTAEEVRKQIESLKKEWKILEENFLESIAE